jgi:MFS family permease
VFIVNVPVGGLALTLTALYVPESRAPRARRIDPIGQLLVIVALASCTYAIIEGPGSGWTSGRTLGLLGVAFTGLLALWRYESRRREPLIDVRFFKSIPFSGASMIALCSNSALAGTLFLNTLYLQDVRHYSSLHTGLFMLPLAAMMLILGPISGRIVGTLGPRSVLAGAGLFLTAGPLMLTGLTTHTAPLYLLAANLVSGIGFGLVNPAINNTAVVGMPATQAGVAAAVSSTSRQVGATLGVAIVGAVASAGTVAAIGGGFARASHPGWWIISGFGLAVFLIGLASTTRWALATTAVSAEHLEPARVAVY